MKISVNITKVKTETKQEKYKISLRGPFPKDLCFVYLTEKQLFSLKNKLEEFFKSKQDPFL